MCEPYVCNLSPATQKKALEELNEDPKNRQGAIDTFREWILQQKHMKCPTDNVFLLAFLRARKFSQLEARRLLENFLHRRDKFGEWFKDMDSTAPYISTALDAGFTMVLPGRDKEGRRIFILRPGKADPSFKKVKKVDFFRVMATTLDYVYLTDEETQVNGTVTILDFSGMTVAHQTKISIEERKNFIQTWQKNYPARMKEFHVYNGGAFMEFIMMIIKMAMSEKIQKRMTIHTRGLETLYQKVPMEMLPEEYLPDDYEGATAGTEKEIIEKMKQGMAVHRDRLKYLSSREFKIDMKDKDTAVPQASFRKLNVD